MDPNIYVSIATVMKTYEIHFMVDDVITSPKRAVFDVQYAYIYQIIMLKIVEVDEKSILRSKSFVIMAFSRVDIIT